MKPQTLIATNAIATVSLCFGCAKYLTQMFRAGVVRL